MKKNPSNSQNSIHSLNIFPNKNIIKSYINFLIFSLFKQKRKSSFNIASALK